MKLLHNELGQPIGVPVPGWTAREQPPRTPMEGRFARIEVLDPERHAAELYDANAEDAEGRIWTYLGYGPFADYAAYRGWAAKGWLIPTPGDIIDFSVIEADLMSFISRFEVRNIG